jgi:hypothetical protein
MQRSRIVPTASVLGEVDLHNTIECSLPGWEHLGLLPRSRPRAYHSLLGRSCFVLSGFWFFSCLAFDLSWVGMIVVLLGLCVLVP